MPTMQEQKIAAIADMASKIAKDLTMKEVGGMFHLPPTQARHFAYSSLLGATNQQCQETFATTFAHKDWVDGVDLVQAGQTPNDDGFNVRFHKIKNDLDSIEQNLLTAFSCIADLRASLHQSLVEVANEINTIDGDIYDLQQRTSALEGQPAIPVAWGLIQGKSLTGGTNSDEVNGHGP